jgi:L-aspartate oxidase
LTQTLRHDGVLIIGGGMAGLSAALEAAPRRVLVVTPAPLLEACSSAWAQGGVAAALRGEDSAELHAADTLAAGAGLVVPEAAHALTSDGRGTIEWLAGLGAPFDRTAGGDFAVGLEAAHSRARVARVGGDGAGRAILSTLVVALRGARHVTTWDSARLRDLIQNAEGRVIGALIEREGRLVRVLAPAVVLATGGYGGLYARTTTPTSLIGEGLALAWRAGAEIRDPEFVQFHPTAINVGLDPMPLATEALRGEGARLIDATGALLLGGEPDADLQARDIVARAVHAAVASGQGAFLDARSAVGEAFPAHFPAVFATCMRAGLDPRFQPIPVAAAAHYSMGGIAAETDGATTLPGLFAVGECASTGVHGANRLASNSLLEAASFGRRTGRAAATLETSGSRAVGALASPSDLPTPALQRLRATMSSQVGVVRDATGLERALEEIATLESQAPGTLPLLAARLIAESALARRESRGGHFRSDYPDTLPQARHTVLRRPGSTDPTPTRKEEIPA